MPDQQKFTSTVEIAAPPEKVWSMVSDLPRMGEWSPENVGGKWKGGATEAAPGVKFKGANKNGWHRWSGGAVINEATAPSRIAFLVKIGGLNGATWSYDIEPTANGCKVTESWLDTRSSVFKVGLITKLATGVADRTGYAQELMDTTLANIKKAAEAG
jgi:uncharacterized protein YndB with AHSA1/START domain